MDSYSTKAKSSKPRQLSMAGFLKISLGLCLTNFMVITRLHMFDESPTAGQEFLSKKTNVFQSQVQPIYVPNPTNLSDVLGLFTNLNLEATYLLPLILEISSLCVALSSTFMDRIYLNLVVCLAGNLAAFLLLWFNNQDMLFYRATYIIQALLVYPSLIISSFGLVKLFPKHLMQIKGYFVALMLLLPQLSVPFSYWCMQGTEGAQKTQHFYSSILKFVTFGSVISFVTLYGLIESREAIAHTLEYGSASTGSLDPSTIEIREHKQALEAKFHIKIKSQLKSSPKVFEIKPDDSLAKKETKFFISKQKLGVLITIWALGIAISKQLPEVKKSLLTALVQSNSNPEIEVALRKSTASSQFFAISITIAVTLGIIWMMRRKKFQVFKLIAGSYMVGYGALMILFLASNSMIGLSLWQINKCIEVGQIFFLSITIPGFMLIEEAGINIAEGVSILFVMGWAFQLLLRILMLFLEAQTKIFILAVIAVVCCYGVQKIGKQSKVEEETWYNKLKEGVEMEIQTAAREQEQSIQSKIQQQLKSAS